MAKDPVCGMEVDEGSAFSGTYGAETQYFCSDECKKKFEEGMSTEAE